MDMIDNFVQNSNTVSNTGRSFIRIELFSFKNCSVHRQTPHAHLWSHLLWCSNFRVCTEWSYPLQIQCLFVIPTMTLQAERPIAVCLTVYWVHRWFGSLPSSNLTGNKDFRYSNYLLATRWFDWANELYLDTVWEAVFFRFMATLWQITNSNTELPHWLIIWTILNLPQCDETKSWIDDTL